MLRLPIVHRRTPKLVVVSRNLDPFLLHLSSSDNPSVRPSPSTSTASSPAPVFFQGVKCLEPRKVNNTCSKTWVGICSICLKRRIKA